MPVTQSAWRQVGPYLVRLVPWPSIVGAIGAAALIGALAPRPNALHWTLVVLAAGVAVSAALDDVAAAVLASSPTSLRRRWTLRLALALPVTAASAATGLWLVSRRMAIVERGDAALELGGAVAVALVLAAVSLRRAPASPAGAVAGPLLLAVTAVTAGLPERVAIYPVAGHRVAWLLAIGVAAALVAALAADPAHRRVAIIERRRR